MNHHWEGDSYLKYSDYMVIFVFVTSLAIWSLVGLHSLKNQKNDSSEYLNNRNTIGRVTQTRDLGYFKAEKSNVWHNIKTSMDITDGGYLATEDMSQIFAHLGSARSMILGEDSLLQMRQVLRRGRQDSLILHLLYGHVLVDYDKCTKACPTLVVRAARRLVAIKPGERKLLIVNDRNSLDVIDHPTQMPLRGRSKISFILPEGYLTYVDGAENGWRDTAH